MKKIVILVCVLLCSWLSAGYAGGGLAHMFVAEEAIAKLPDAKLRYLLLNNLDAYLVGAYYPDSGYTKGARYGEDSHWDPFINAFADYIKTKYPDNPTEANPKLIAFLFGCAAHRVSDEIMHWTFYPEIARKDLHTTDWEKAHMYGDLGIDLLLNIDKNQWLTFPSRWWVPVSDLVNVYKRMGKNYSAKEIIWGNSVISVAGYGERLISGPAYPILKWKIAWTAAHYYAWPQGGMLSDEQTIANYQMQLWMKLKEKKVATKVMPGITGKNPSYPIRSQPIADLAANALENGSVVIPIQAHQDGSVEIQPPIIRQYIQFKLLLDALLTKIS